MDNRARLTVAMGALLALLGVALGAAGAHAMKGADAGLAAIFHTANEYHLVHALSLIALGLVRNQNPPSRLLQASAWLMGAGVVLFCGGLYLRALTGEAAYSLAAPFGGTSLLAAWLMFALAMFRR